MYRCLVKNLRIESCYLRASLDIREGILIPSYCRACFCKYIEHYFNMLWMLGARHPVLPAYLGLIFRMYSI